MRSWPVLIAVVHGTSMLPALAPGDIVVAVRWRRGIRTGRIVVADIDGRLIIKRVAGWDAMRQRVLLGVESPFGWLDAALVRYQVVACLTRSRSSAPSARSVLRRVSLVCAPRFLRSCPPSSGR